MERFRFGLSSCGVQDLTEADFSEFEKVGLQELELSFASEKYQQLEWENIKRRAEKYHVNLWSFHLPFYPFSQIDIAGKEKTLRDASVKYLSEFVKKAADIGIEIMVVHPSGEPNREDERGELLVYAQDSLCRLADVADTCGAKIAVENLPRTCLGRDSDEILQLIAADQRLGVCFDTNHLLKQPIIEFIRAIGSRIITTHVSDFDFVNERHWLPGEGQINWKELVETLELVGYKGPLLYEVRFDAPDTIARRMLTCQDFRENCDRLKNKYPLTALGKPLV